jgi:uncharacterized membrane protein
MGLKGLSPANVEEIDVGKGEYMISMPLLEIVLGGGVALLWGLADSIAALSTRYLTTLTTTFLAHLSGLFTLLIILFILLWRDPSLTFVISSQGLFIGVGTGLLTVIGYLALYRSLELGPVAITSPLSSISAVFCLLLSVLFLQERITLFDGFASGAIMSGVFMASVNVQDVRLFLKKKPKELLAGKGIGWACITPVAFGLVDIGIGASSPHHGWFVPVFLTFVVSSLTLTLLFLGHHLLGQGEKPLFMRLNPLVYQPVGLLFAVGAGILESLASIIFGIATQTSKPGIIAAIASNYALIAVLFAVYVLGERLMVHQKVGIGVVLCGLTFITLTHL